MEKSKDKEILAESISVKKSVDSYSQMAKGLNSLNTNRGGQYGFKGYAFEELHAADQRIFGSDVKVLNSNGAADLMIDGVPTQLKMGYHDSNPKWCKGYQNVVVDRGNIQLIEKAKKAGYTVEESSISACETQALSNIMKKESTLTNNINAPITGTIASSHYAGKAAAGLTGKVVVPLQMGVNLYDVVNGTKNIEDAVADTIVDGAVAVGSAYASAAALTAASTAATAAGTVIAETAVGSALCATASAAASTAIGSVAVGAVGTVGAVASSAVATVAAAPILPVVAVAAGIGFIASAISDWW